MYCFCLASKIVVSVFHLIFDILWVCFVHVLCYRMKRQDGPAHSCYYHLYLETVIWSHLQLITGLLPSFVHHNLVMNSKIKVLWTAGVDRDLFLNVKKQNKTTTTKQATSHHPHKITPCSFSCVQINLKRHYLPCRARATTSDGEHY